MYVKGLFDCSALWDRVSLYSVQFANIVSQHTVHDKFEYSELNSHMPYKFQYNPYILIEEARI